MTDTADTADVTTYWYNLRNSLEKIPALFKAAREVGLSDQDVIDLLLIIVTVIRKNAIRSSYSDEVNCSSEKSKYSIEGLTSFFKYCAAVKINFDDETVYQFKKLTTLILNEGSLEKALYTATLCLQAGLSVPQTFSILDNVCKTAWHTCYYFGDMSNGLFALAPNNADGDLLYRTIQAIGTRYHSHISGLATLLYTTATNTTYSQNAVLQMILDAAENKLAKKEEHHSPLDTVILEIFSNTDNSITIQQPHEVYFPDIGERTQNVIHGILPYRIQKSLSGGLQDLEKLMKEEFVEGTFCFDPSAKIWYSLGGKTTPRPDALHCEFIPYDLSELSSHPVFVHIHPEKCEYITTPYPNSLPEPYSYIREKIGKFYAAIPSPQDYATVAGLLEETSGSIQLSALIVTSTGITGFSFPNNPSEIQNFSEALRDIKIRVVEEFDAGNYLRSADAHENDKAFVQRMFALLNEKLPKGFAIKQYTVDELSSFFENDQRFSGVAEGQRMPQLKYQ